MDGLARSSLFGQCRAAPTVTNADVISPSITRSRGSLQPIPAAAAAYSSQTLAAFERLAGTKGPRRLTSRRGNRLSFADFEMNFTIKRYTVVPSRCLE